MPFVPLAKEHLRYYRIAQVILYTVTFFLLFFLILRSLFPTTIDTFDFENPTSSKHTLLPPQNEKREVAYNGQLAENASLIFNVGASAEDASVSLKTLVEKKSPLSNNLSFTLRHGYRASWLPTGEAVSDFPAVDLYVSDGIYYMLRDGKLIRFVSRDAYLSRYPEEFAKVLTSEEQKSFSEGEGVIGFRPGLLAAYGDGVFIIMNETDMRPVGSARIFQEIGYRFEDVQNLNAEELGIYKRGKIFLSGDRHPDGTVFQDTVTSRYFIVGDGQFHELLPGRYLDFLLNKARPVLFSSETRDRTVSCNATPNLLTHGLHCTLPLASISGTIGSDYEIRLTNKGASMDLRSFEAHFKTARNKANLVFIISQIKDLFLSRFGAN